MNINYYVSYSSTKAYVSMLNDSLESSKKTFTGGATTFFLDKGIYSITIAQITAAADVRFSDVNF